MAEIKTLRVLAVMNNNIDRVPLSLGSLDSLRVIKLTGNPLDVQLRRIIDGTDTNPSPLATPLAENGKEVLVTLRIKQFLKHEAAALESGSRYSERMKATVTVLTFVAVVKVRWKLLGH